METGREQKKKARRLVSTAEKALRTKDVAHILDCSPDDVIELCKKGKLQAFREGRFWRIKPSAVRKYQRMHKESTEGAA